MMVGDTVVAILTHNRRMLLEQQLEACVRGQGDAKVVVADNASDDGTTEMLQERWPHVLHLRHDENLGDVGNYLSVLRKVDAKYLVITHDDDVLDPGYVQRAREALEARPEAVGVGCNVRYIDAKSVVMQPRLYETSADRWFGRGEYVLEYLRSGLWIPCSTMMIRATAEVRTELEGQGTVGDARLGGNRDVFAFCQLNRLGSVGLLGEVCASYRQHADQASKVDDFVAASAELHAAVAELWCDDAGISRANAAKVRASELEARLGCMPETFPEDAFDWAARVARRLSPEEFLAMVEFAPQVLIAAFFGNASEPWWAESIRSHASSAIASEGRVRWLLARLRGERTPMERVRALGVSRLAIFGAMANGWLLAEDARRAGLEVVALLDSNRSRRGCAHRGCTVRAPEWLVDHATSIDAVISSSERDRSTEVAATVSALTSRLHPTLACWWWKRIPSATHGEDA